MKTCSKLYSQFFKTTISQPATSIIFLAGLILNVVFIVAVPIGMNFSQDDATKIWSIKTMSTLVSICTVSLFCSVLGEIIANPNDRIFILSRPVKRSIYLTAKLALSITFAAFFALLISVCYIVLQKWADSKNIDLYTGQMKFQYMIASTFVLCIFGGVVGTSLRYYSREMIVSVIVLVASMSYGIGFSFPITQAPEKGPKLEYIESFIVPLTAILPITFSIIGIGYFLNHKVNVGS